jgi:putative transposase
MPDYRRWRVPGGTYFFTVVTYQRRRLFDSAVARELLGSVIRDCRTEWSFHIDAIVLLPDHLHAIWTLPTSDDRYSARWSRIKKEFTRAWLQRGGVEAAPSPSQKREGRRGVWQPRFWEHVIRDERDFERHADYVHYNPVKHGLSSRPADWPHSTFRQWVERGSYPADWGRTAPDFSELDEDAME